MKSLLKALVYPMWGYALPYKGHALPYSVSGSPAKLRFRRLIANAKLRPLRGVLAPAAPALEGQDLVAEINSVIKHLDPSMVFPASGRDTHSPANSPQPQVPAPAGAHTTSWRNS